MANFTQAELEEALRAINSTLGKSEKAQTKLRPGTFQHAMTAQAIQAYYIAAELIKSEFETSGGRESRYGKEELLEALQAIASAMHRVERVKPQFAAGTPQHTLAVRRIKAFQIATELIKREISHFV